MNDVHLSDPEGTLYRVMINVAEGKTEKHELTTIFQKLSR
jgi:hypothetical protein